MSDILMDTWMDGIRLLPFLFITYLVMEYIEHRVGEHTKQAIEKAGRFGPFPGGLLGAFPQCGFSAAASNLYAGRVITLGTLMAVFLSTSDEMLPILISEQIQASVIVRLLGLKIIIGIAAGFLVDLCIRKRQHTVHTREGNVIRHMDIEHVCEHEGCNCERGIFRSALYHTLHIFLFIILIGLALNAFIHFIGESFLTDLALSRPVLGHVIAGLVGMIPNCASSVVITQLYLEGVLGLGTMMSGLLTGTGVGLLVLFKVSGNRKENLKIAFLLYIIGVTAGMLIDVVGLVI